MGSYTMIVWLYGICKAWGFYSYARERYSNLVGNGKSLKKLIESGKGTVRDYVEGGIMGDFGPGCDARDLSREELLQPLSNVKAVGGLHPDEILEALSFAKQYLHPSTLEPNEPTLKDARPDTCWPDRKKKSRSSTDYTCGGVRPDWMAATHKSLAKEMSSMENEKRKRNWYKDRQWNGEGFRQLRCLYEMVWIIGAYRCLCHNRIPTILSRRQH